MNESQTALVPCECCGHQISPAARACPRCGHGNSAGRNTRKSLLLGLGIGTSVAALVGVCLMLVVFANRSKDAEANEAEPSVPQEQASVTPEQAPKSALPEFKIYRTKRETVYDPMTVENLRPGAQLFRRHDTQLLGKIVGVSDARVSVELARPIPLPPSKVRSLGDRGMYYTRNGMAAEAELRKPRFMYTDSIDRAEALRMLTNPHIVETKEYEGVLDSTGKLRKDG